MQGLAKQSDKYMGEVIKLPSNYQVGYEVCLSFGTGPLIPKCHITKVIFTRTKVLYDVEIQIYEMLPDGQDGYLPMCVGHTRIHSVDSAFVKPFDFGRVTEGNSISEWNPRNERPCLNESVECRHVGLNESYPHFFAHVKWTHSGYEWFTDEEDPIKDAVQFEWKRIKLS